MKKEYLRRTYQTTATDEMMKMAENDHPVKEKKWYGTVVENYKTDIYIRCQVIEGILKVSFFQTHDMRLGSNKPAYELYIDKDTGQFFTWDAVCGKWKTAILDHMGWTFYDRISRSYMDPEDNLLMKQYLGVSKDGYDGIANYQYDVRERQLEERHRRETDPWDLVMSKVPALPAGWERWVDKQAIHYNYIFYDYSKKKHRPDIVHGARRKFQLKNQSIIRWENAHAVVIRFSIKPKEGQGDLNRLRRQHIFFSPVGTIWFSGNLKSSGIMRGAGIKFRNHISSKNGGVFITVQWNQYGFIMASIKILIAVG